MEPVLSAETRRLLGEALGEAQRIGMMGKGSLDSVIDRSLGFVHQLPSDARTIIDLGSGGGDPGLVVASARPHLLVTLVDRRAKRTDLLVRLVGRLGLTDQVEVVEGDVAQIPQILPGRRWDAATSRGFGSPAYTAAHAADLLVPSGCLLVSEPPDSDGSRWTAEEVECTGLKLDSVAFGVARLFKKA